MTEVRQLRCGIKEVHRHLGDARQDNRRHRPARLHATCMTAVRQSMLCIQGVHMRLGDARQVISVIILQDYTPYAQHDSSV
jgi:hypothetical protein